MTSLGIRPASLCGMDRGQFNFSRMLIKYKDGTITALCSLHCAAIDLAKHIDKTPILIQVGDYNSRQLINAANRFLGGWREEAGSHVQDRDVGL